MKNATSLVVACSASGLAEHRYPAGRRCLLVLIFISIFATANAQTRLTPEQVKSNKGWPEERYRLVMSENDSLCDAVLNAYNAHYRELKFDHNSSVDTVTQPDTFKFLAPDAEWYYHADIFDDGKPRLIAKRVFWSGRSGYDEFFILNADMTKSEVKTPADIENLTDIKISFVDPQPYWLTSERVPYYLLSKYPGDSLIELPPSPNPIVNYPQYIYGSYTNNLISFNGRVFGIARQTVYGPTLKDGNLFNGHQFILVYRVQPERRIEDICYLEVRGKDFSK
jgi:hypothetical protein